MAKIPADILKASKEYDKQREDKQEWVYQKEFNSYQELANVLKKDEFNAREQLADTWNSNHPKSKTNKQASDIKLNFNMIGDVLNRHLHYCKLGDSETDRVAFYDVMKGIYILDYSFIQWCIFQVAPILTEKNSYNVIYYLKQKASVKPLTKDKNLIVVGNGIFNLESKKLEPFSPDYVFTNKIDTNYNEKALQSPKIYGWEFDQWLLDLTKDDKGQTDKEIYKIYWQVIADSLNGNYSHEKSHFLIFTTWW